MSGKGQRIGYIRVSTDDQHTHRQLEGVALDRVFTDRASGKDADRPGLRELLSYAREGDTIVVHSMDRLARNVDDLRRLVLSQAARGITVEFVKESLSFSGEGSPMAHLMLTLLGAVAQFERELIRERQREGIAMAKKRGVYRGRRRKLTPDQVEALRTKAAAGGKAALAREMGISRQTLYDYLRGPSRTDPSRHDAST
jgi:DNA invertase Pin-like site-specific DNA recombinase